MHETVESRNIKQAKQIPAQHNVCRLAFIVLYAYTDTHRHTHVYRTHIHFIHNCVSFLVVFIVALHLYVRRWNIFHSIMCFSLFVSCLHATLLLPLPYFTSACMLYRRVYVGAVMSCQRSNKNRVYPEWIKKKNSIREPLYSTGIHV